MKTGDPKPEWPYPEAMWPIYKYQAINTQTLGNLAARKLWASSPTAFNDPFECRLQRAKSPGGIDALRHQNPHLANLSDDQLVESTFETQFKAWGIICFARSPDNILMWSHYADHHRGICMGFSDSKPPMERGIYPVEYSETYPELTFDRVWHREGLSRVLYTKHAGWSYEDELRNITIEGNRLLEYPGALSRIIFGLRTSAAEEELVRTMVGGNSGIEFMRVVLEATSYGLRIVAA
jgi:hypothetical protein